MEEKKLLLEEYDINVEDLGLSADADIEEAFGLLATCDYEGALDRLHTARTRAMNLAKIAESNMFLISSQKDKRSYVPRYLG